MRVFRVALAIGSVALVMVAYTNCTSWEPAKITVAASTTEQDSIAPMPTPSPNSSERDICARIDPNGISEACSGVAPDPSNLSHTKPAIFWVPHQDDDAIGFAGAIAEHKLAGRPVVVVLITNGENDDLVHQMRGHDQTGNQKVCGLSTHLNYGYEPKDLWPLHPNIFPFSIFKGHSDVHTFTFDSNKVMAARNAEFMASMRVLGVDSVFIAGNGAGISDASFYTTDGYANGVAKIERTIAYFHLRYPDASHKFPSGHLDTGYTGINPTHKAISEAALRVQDKYGLEDMLFYRIYVYGDTAGNLSRHPPSIVQEIEPAWLTKKRAALHEYIRFEPAAGRYGLGYHSVPDLIDKAYVHPKQYIDTAADIRAKILTQ